jgi:hypothetical protein
MRLFGHFGMKHINRQKNWTVFENRRKKLQKRAYLPFIYIDVYFDDVIGNWDRFKK